MLDKRSVSVLNYIVKMCDEGSYKVIAVEDIIANVPARFKFDSDNVSQIIKYLQEREFLDIKYNDDKVYCLAPLPKARLHTENEAEEQKDTKKLKRLILISVILSAVAGFVGALLGSMIGKLGR